MMHDRNPLTGLPGNIEIQSKLEQLVVHGDSTAAYIDIVDFKPFNDYYGFALGDSVIRRLGQILEESVPGCFVGHIGGDDFICVGKGSSFSKGIEIARQRFRSIVPGFYTHRDRELGGIETFDREGSYRFLPLLDIAVVYADAEKSTVTVESLAGKAGRTKKLLKGQQVASPVFPVLRKALELEYSVQNTKALIEACGVLREEGAVDILEGVLHGHYSWNLRKSAALALGYIGNSRCTQLLQSALKDSNPHVRTRSVEGLVVSMGREAGPLIAPLLKDRSTWVRRAVLRGTGHAGWYQGLHYLKDAATGIAPGAGINTSQERRAALEGIAMLGKSEDAEFLAELCGSKDYFPRDAACRALCAVGTDLAADFVIERSTVIPDVLNLAGISSSNLRKLEVIAARSLAAADPVVTDALRFFEGFSPEFSKSTDAEMRKNLGNLSGDLFRRLVVLMDSRNLAADSSCIARVASRIDSGEQIGSSALSAFLGWVAHRGGVSPGSLLMSFLRRDSRPVAASAAIAVRSLASRDLTQMENGETIS
ncbi:hypothetical protein DRQ21_04910 [Candidatus Fermentibacteria bacterium]|nr:MAG: hypothetical protein DRQ21_04910 [Candidatus Fermentibacteria bacterium]